VSAPIVSTLPVLSARVSSVWLKALTLAVLGAGARSEWEQALHLFAGGCSILRWNWAGWITLLWAGMVDAGTRSAFSVQSAFGVVGALGTSSC